MESRKGVARIRHALLLCHSPLEKTPHKTRVVRDGLMAAADALIAMTAQGRSAAADDGIEHLAM